VAIAIIVAVGAVAAGQGFREGSRGGHWHRGRGGADSIGTLRQALELGSPWLDPVKIRDEQRTQLLQIVDRHEPALRQLESERSRLVKQFASTFGTNVVNPAEIEQVRADL